MKTTPLQLDFLDHVAIRVKDLEVSINWYESVLGLKKYQLPKWGAYPIFMLAGKSGIALFPANIDDPKFDFKSKNVGVDHFAFHVTQENFKKAKKKYTELNLDYVFRDHHYFHSIYTEDPDGHTVELTTLRVNENEFYNQEKIV